MGHQTRAAEKERQAHQAAPVKWLNDKGKLSGGSSSSWPEFFIVSFMAR